MALIVDLVQDLLSAPRPVLILDTCDLLDIVQCVQNDQTNHILPAARLAKKIQSDPLHVQLIVSYLVVHAPLNEVPSPIAFTDST